ncbi:KpsF/GutQ family sugar-phosphate isomerase [Granulicella sp. 5B5]|uniref:KpsF/GutQ family sugar-phosphate isomerase n=1 Tax=Granulicella sp. 5B5 TaxID=1617967 RepID=UPI0021050673|nr:KpsF/GutQ family sugar-phosphate isomerase [Granulicella sp. 5B5]
MSPAGLVRIEAAALEQLATRLEGAQRSHFDSLAATMVTAVQAGHRIVLTGVGKSGLIARKIAATLLSTGTPAAFLHPTEALHGDLGLCAAGDILLALSYSGASEELLRLLPVLPKLGVTLACFTGCLTSQLAAASQHVLDISVEREACAHQLAPTASTTAMLALGDALAIDVSLRLDFQPQHFAELHPGGALGRRLTPVRALMHTGDALPSVLPTATLPEIIHEISARRLGVTTVQLKGKLVGLLSDGDLRRLFEREGPEAFHRTAAEICNPEPRTIAPEPFASEALDLMEQHKITALIVTADGTRDTTVLGILHLHDILS